MDLSIIIKILQIKKNPKIWSIKKKKKEKVEMQ